MLVVNQNQKSLFPFEAKGISFFYREESLLENVSLTMENQKIISVMGPNGAGKTLLLRILHGLITPDRGRVLCNGNEMTHHHRLMQGMVSQKATLLRRTVGENLDFVMRIRGGINNSVRTELLDKVGLLGKQKQHSMSLSGGERQRLAVAVVLATQPKLLFVDEVTAYMDPTSTRLIESLLLNEKEKGTRIICVTHDIGQAKRLADEIVFMHCGRIVERSPAKDFFSGAETKEARNYLAGKLLL